VDAPHPSPLPVVTGRGDWESAAMFLRPAGGEKVAGRPDEGPSRGKPSPQWLIALTISSVTFLASPSSIIVPSL
jgi:hypothetical protein